jgi:hypothetical protein
MWGNKAAASPSQAAAYALDRASHVVRSASVIGTYGGRLPQK